MRLWFSVTLFVSAALLFVIQPMIAKMILPLLGGTTAVWNTCMVFFQALLLLGYAYAHVASTRLGVRRHAVLHLGVLLLPFLVLPIRIAGWVPPPDANPAPWLLGLLFAVVGLPFFALATSAPLLQKWFAESGHPAGRDPYFLYAASNLGSMVGLLSYPFLVEPHLSLLAQARAWMAGYAILVVLAAGSVVLLWRSRAAASPGSEARPAMASRKAAGNPGASSAASASAEADSGSPSLARRLRWVGLAFVPSSLMLGVTSYITTDLAAIPLLWVIPLALYLLSFIVVFSRVPGRVHRLVVILLPVAIVALALARIFQARLAIGVAVELHLTAFFVVALACHGELARDRPPSRHLTGFYLWMAAGGVVGGVLNALVAPQVFDRIVEYPLVIVIACFLHPGASLPARAPGHAAAAGKRAPTRPAGARETSGPAAGRPRFLSPAWTAFGVVMGVLFLLQSIGGDPRLLLYSGRNFYGVHRVKFDPTRNVIGLLHGSTVHGIQSRDPARRGEPLSYYHRTGPIGQVFASLAGPRAKPEIAVIGLGIGTLACYVGSGQALTYYEIDPAIERVATDTTYFTYLEDCRARGTRLRIVTGDARLQLMRSSDRYGLLVLDAFSSDVVPIHLVTREALRGYLAHLDADGILAMHISSRYLVLAPVLAALARDAGLVCLFQVDPSLSEDEKRSGLESSQWVVMARRPADLASLWNDARWRHLAGDPHARVWTDDYSNVLSAITWSREATEHLRESPTGGFGR